VQLKQSALKALLNQPHCFNTLEFSDAALSAWACRTWMTPLQAEMQQQQPLQQAISSTDKAHWWRSRRYAPANVLLRDNRALGEVLRLLALLLLVLLSIPVAHLGS
jgi:hypothetical protein